MIETASMSMLNLIKPAIATPLAPFQYAIPTISGSIKGNSAKRNFAVRSGLCAA
jgi:hypothetical protein